MPDWNWQQGCMLQWVPGFETDVLWNDRDGDRFVILHRWRDEMTTRQQRATGGWTTRMFSANMDGTDLYLLNDSRLISHFIRIRIAIRNCICTTSQPIVKLL